MRVAVVGPRGYGKMELVRQYVRGLPADTVVVSGGTLGVDDTAVSEAKLCGLATTVYLPEWAKYGKSAGFKRNVLIVNDADVVVAFWDGRSKGTKHSMDLAVSLGKPLITPEETNE